MSGSKLSQSKKTKNMLIKTRAQLALAFKSLLNAPGFVSSIILTMSLTLAVLFVVAALVNTYFFKPLPVLQEPSLYVLEQEVDTPFGIHAKYQSYKGMVHWFNTQASFEKAAIISPDDIMITSLPGEPKMVATYTSPDYFDIFQVPMLLGQPFSSELKLDDAVDQILISERLWRSYFDSDPDILSKTMSDGDRSFTISGVIADTFKTPHMFYSGQGDVWLHFGMDRRFYNNGEWDNPWDNTYGSLKIIGIAKQGFSVEDVYQDLDARIEDIRAEWAEGYPTSTDFRPLLTSYRSLELGDKGKLSLLLLAGSIGLLCIAIVNVSNLFFSRALAQHKTLAIQAVLGANRKLLFNSVLSQTMILMGLSVACALFLSAWGIKLFKFLAQGELPLVHAISIDINLVVLAFILTIGLALLFAFVSANLINFNNLRSQIQASGKGGVNQVSGMTVKVLIALQVALATILVVTACFVLNKTQSTLNRPMGSHVDNMYAVIAFIRDDNQNTTVAERFEKRHQIKTNLAAMEDIKRVSVGTSPVNETLSKSTLENTQGVQSKFMPQTWVGRDYFDHTGLKILQGRTFSDEAMRGEKPEIMISQSLAYQLQDDGNVLGKVYKGHSPDLEIVGITENFNHPSFYHQDEGAHIWYPSVPYGYHFIVEMQDGQGLDQEAILKYLRAQDSRFNIWEFRSLSQSYSQIIYIDKLTLTISYILAAFTLFLASVGIYGVLSYNLGLRRFEFGIRMALGAKQSRLYQLLLKEAIIPLFTGSLIALISLALIYYLYADMLSTWLLVEPGFAILAVLATLMTALFASLKPMHKIIHNQPMRALRDE